MAASGAGAKLKGVCRTEHHKTDSAMQCSKLRHEVQHATHSVDVLSRTWLRLEQREDCCPLHYLPAFGWCISKYLVQSLPSRSHFRVLARRLRSSNPAQEVLPVV